MGEQIQYQPAKQPTNDDTDSIESIAIGHHHPIKRSAWLPFCAVSFSRLGPAMCLCDWIEIGLELGNSELKAHGAETFSCDNVS